MTLGNGSLGKQNQKGGDYCTPSSLGERTGPWRGGREMTRIGHMETVRVCMDGGLWARLVVGFAGRKCLSRAHSFRSD